MNKIIKVFFIPLVVIMIIGIFSSCRKFLGEKPTPSLVVPHTTTDLQRLLDNKDIMNLRGTSGYAEMVADNYYLEDSYYEMFNAVDGANWYTQNYIWAPNAHPIYLFWSYAYSGPVYYSNIVLDQLSKISTEPKDSSVVRSLKGSALFYRAFAFYHLAQLYCRPYAQEYLSAPGIVLRLTSDAGVIDRKRAPVGETYDRIIADLKEAAGLLPLSSSVPTRPCQTAAYAMLSRVYLSMRKYVEAALYANLALQQKYSLLDYNTRMPVGNPPIQVFNPEVIFDNIANPALLVNPGFATIDTLLYQSYDANDLRKDLFFGINSGRCVFQGSYNSANYGGDPSTVFDGLATDELYLTRAECSARSGNKDSAMADLKRLLIYRWKNTEPLPVMAPGDADEALTQVLIERRKELVYRGLRWTDIRRLNLEDANIILKRYISGAHYELPPNDPRTVMLIPDEEIAMSGIEQNTR